MITLMPYAIEVSFSLASETETASQSTTPQGVTSGFDNRNKFVNYANPLLFSGTVYGQQIQNIELDGPISPDAGYGGPNASVTYLGSVNFGQSDQDAAYTGSSDGSTTFNVTQTNFHLVGSIAAYREGLVPRDSNGNILEGAVLTNPTHNHVSDQTPDPAYNFDHYSSSSDNYYSSIWIQLYAPVESQDSPPINSPESIDNIISGAKNLPITSVPQVADDSGYRNLDALADWWNNGGGLDLGKGNVGSLIEAEAQLFPLQNAILHQISLFGDPNSLSTMSPDPATSSNITDLVNAIRGPIESLIDSDISGSDDFQGMINNARATALATRDFDIAQLSNDQQQLLSASDNLVSQLAPSADTETKNSLLNVATDVLDFGDFRPVYGPLDQVMTGVTSLVGIASGIEKFNSENPEQQKEGFAQIIANTGTLESAFGVAGAGALSTNIANAAQVEFAFETGDASKIAVAISKCATVLACTTIGAEVGGFGGADKGATFGQAAADLASRVGDTTSSILGNYLDNHDDLLQAYNNGGYAGLEKQAYHELISSMSTSERSAFQGIVDGSGLGIAGRIVYGISYATHAFAGSSP